MYDMAQQLHPAGEGWNFQAWTFMSYLQQRTCSLITVLEPTGIPVTGTPSISLEFNFIISRWTIYMRSPNRLDKHMFSTSAACWGSELPLLRECAMYRTPLENVVPSFKLMTTTTHMKERQFYALLLSAWNIIPREQRMTTCVQREMPFRDIKRWQL